MEAAKVAEPMEGKSMQWMKSQAQKKDAAVCGSLIIEEEGKYYNRFIWVQPDGIFYHYDKRHLFTLAGEDEYFQKGKERLLIQYKGWRICPLICYDLRFPVFARNDIDYDLLIYVANWPKPRANAWRTLLAARAIENQCYVAGVNRIGKDEKGLEYIGDTMLIDYLGDRIFHSAHTQQVSTASVSKTKMLSLRSKLNFLADRDEFKIIS